MLAGAGHNYISTEHILLGLLREGEGVAARVLETLGADPAKIRSQVRTVADQAAIQKHRLAVQASAVVHCITAGCGNVCYKRAVREISQLDSWQHVQGSNKHPGCVTLCPSPVLASISLTCHKSSCCFCLA